MNAPPTREIRPQARKADHSKSLAGDSSSMPEGAPDSHYPVETTHRRNWARQLLEAGAGWPIYGSPAWNVLPMDDPKRVAACVAAAEAYTQRYDDLESELHREVAIEREAFKKTEDRAYLESFADHIKRSGGRVLTSFEERRRRQLEAAKPRPGDHPGGPGKPWTGGAS